MPMIVLKRQQYAKHIDIYSNLLQALNEALIALDSW